MPRRQARESTLPDRADLAALRRRLLRWYRRARRDLPWRRSRDPYRVWVSEVMLQQTRVEVVASYFEPFLARFPDVVSLARAPLGAVLESWAGLGYYRRARALHAAARHIVAMHAGRFPADPDAIAALPGVGPYTLGAIQSIAFDAPAPIVDGNVKRVLSRLFGLGGDPTAAPARRTFWSLAGAWAACRTPGEANQALMELGATVCTPLNPRCPSCPLASCCVARRSGRTDALPAVPPRPRVEGVQLDVALVERRGRLLLVRRRSGALLTDWWDLPACRSRSASATEPAVGAVLGTRLGVRATRWRPLGVVRHGILRHRLEAHLLVAEGVVASLTTQEARRGASRRHESRSRSRPVPAIATFDAADVETRWVTPEECRSLPLATLARKALGEAARGEARWRVYLRAGAGFSRPRNFAAPTRAPCARPSPRRGT
jgi:A/G-specific adenine glycosylase